MKNYFKHFKIPYIVFGIVLFIFVAVYIKNIIPKEFFYKEILYVTGQVFEEVEGKAETGTNDYKLDLLIFAGAFLVAVVSTVSYVYVTRPEKDSKTTTEKTFIGYRLVNDTRDVMK